MRPIALFWLFLDQKFQICPSFLERQEIHCAFLTRTIMHGAQDHVISISTVLCLVIIRTMLLSWKTFWISNDAEDFHQKDVAMIQFTRHLQKSQLYISLSMRIDSARIIHMLEACFTTLTWVSLGCQYLHCHLLHFWLDTNLACGDALGCLHQDPHKPYTSCFEFDTCKIHTQLSFNGPCFMHECKCLNLYYKGHKFKSNQALPRLSIQLLQLKMDFCHQYTASNEHADTFETVFYVTNLQ